MSLPEDAYLFYKSLFIYKMELDIPFGDLININGNTVGWNGVIALCTQTGGIIDPYFYKEEVERDVCPYLGLSQK